MVKSVPYFSPVPIFAFIIPLNPESIFFFITILMMPAIPSGSYFTEGLVIISMFWMADEGICFRASLPLSTLGRPSIKTVKLDEPRRLTFPSISTSTEGVFSSTVIAVPPAALMSLVTLITFLSILYSTLFRSATTSTSPTFVRSTASSIVPISTVTILGEIFTSFTLVIANPIKLAST